MTITSPSDMPRGIRNKNPGNIIVNHHFVWHGQKGADQDGYCIFKDAVWGLRAMSILIINYVDHYHCNSLHDIIFRWAPPPANETNAYLADVSKRMGYPPYTKIDIHQEGKSLMEAIIRHENGIQPYPDAVLERGMHLAHIR